MATPFHFEHRFRASSPAPLLAAYFDAAHVDEQDRATGVARRERIEETDDPERRRRVCRVFPRRQLPTVVRALVPGDLSFDETIVWVKAADRIDFDIRPRLLGGRARIEARYQLTVTGSMEVQRTYDGTATVELRLVGGRIERAIVDDLGRSLATSAGLTQAYLDRGSAS
jgi:hypothetical protein